MFFVWYITLCSSMSCSCSYDKTMIWQLLSNRQSDQCVFRCQIRNIKRIILKIIIIVLYFCLYKMSQGIKPNEIEINLTNNVKDKNYSTDFWNISEILRRSRCVVYNYLEYSANYIKKHCVNRPRATNSSESRVIS